MSLSLAGVGIVGALIGSTVQYYFSLQQERSKAFEEHQTDAYVSLLDALDKERMSRQTDDKAAAAKLNQQYELEAGAAVHRIAVFGDKQVVEALAEWYRRSSSLVPCEKSIEPEVTTLKLMRDTSVGRGQEVSAEDLGAILGRCILTLKR